MCLILLPITCAPDIFLTALLINFVLVSASSKGFKFLNTEQSTKKISGMYLVFYKSIDESITKKDANLFYGQSVM